METEIFSAEPSQSNSNPSILKAWIFFLLIATFGGALAGFVAGAFLGGILGGAGATMEQIQLYCGIAGFLVSLPISFLTYRWSVNKFILGNR